MEEKRSCSYYSSRVVFTHALPAPYSILLAFHMQLLSSRYWRNDTQLPSPPTPFNLLHIQVNNLYLYVKNEHDNWERNKRERITRQCNILKMKFIERLLGEINEIHQHRLVPVESRSPPQYWKSAHGAHDRIVFSHFTQKRLVSISSFFPNPIFDITLFSFLSTDKKRNYVQRFCSMKNTLGIFNDLFDFCYQALLPYFFTDYSSSKAIKFMLRYTMYV